MGNLIVMSTAYINSIRIGAQSGPGPGMNKETWLRHKRVASDTRLPGIDPALLPESFTALHELSKMSDVVLKQVVRLGLLGPDTSSRYLRTIRVTGRVKVEVKVPLGRVPELRERFGA